jgi:hypothetical protein
VRTAIRSPGRCACNEQECSCRERRIERQCDYVNVASRSNARAC